MALKVALFTILFAFYFFETLQQTTAKKTEQENPIDVTTSVPAAVDSKPQKGGQGSEPNKINALLKKRLDALAAKLGVTCQ